MYLKCNRRFKDGKEHRYWSPVESRRCAGGQVVQCPVLYLGEINDSQRESWCRTIEAFDPQQDRTLPLALFPADRPVPAHAAGFGVQLELAQMEVHRPRQGEGAQRDHMARKCQVKRSGRWTVTYWPEPLANEIHILDVDRLMQKVLQKSARGCDVDEPRNLAKSVTVE